MFIDRTWKFTQWKIFKYKLKKFQRKAFKNLNFAVKQHIAKNDEKENAKKNKKKTITMKKCRSSRKHSKLSNSFDWNQSSENAWHFVYRCCAIKSKMTNTTVHWYVRWRYWTSSTMNEKISANIFRFCSTLSKSLDAWLFKVNEKENKTKSQISRIRIRKAAAKMKRQISIINRNRKVDWWMSNSS